MRRRTATIAVLALVLAGCGDDDDDTAATSSTTAATSTSSTTTGPDDGSIRLTESCDSPDGFTVSYPQDWGAVSDCGQFGPEPIEEPTPNTDERTGVVSAFTDPVPYEQVAGPADGERDRREATVDGRPAVRVTGAESGIGLYPEGTEYVRWLVDVSGPATLFIDAHDLRDDVDFDRTVDVLDAMVASVVIGGR